jgi:hypothetical protein
MYIKILRTVGEPLGPHLNYKSVICHTKLDMTRFLVGQCLSINNFRINLRCGFVFGCFIWKRRDGPIRLFQRFDCNSNNKLTRVIRTYILIGYAITSIINWIIQMNSACKNRHFSHIPQIKYTLITLHKWTRRCVNVFMKRILKVYWYYVG